jgi:co-chaperonin GroES (HSP10)
MTTRLPVVPVGWKILVKPVDPITSVNGIELPEETIRAQEYLRNHGKVLAVGDLSYTEARLGNRPWCRVGDVVMYPRNAGTEILLQDGTSMKLINDDEVIGLVADEDQLRRRM